MTSTYGLKNVMGTTAYLAPELCHPASAKPSAATDMYAFAMTALEILTPNLPYPWHGDISVTTDPWPIYRAVKEGKRPSFHDLCTFYPEEFESRVNNLVAMIKKCWLQNPLHRIGAAMVQISVQELDNSTKVRQSPRLTPTKSPSKRKLSQSWNLESTPKSHGKRQLSLSAVFVSRKNQTKDVDCSSLDKTPQSTKNEQSNCSHSIHDASSIEDKLAENSSTRILPFLLEDSEALLDSSGEEELSTMDLIEASPSLCPSEQTISKDKDFTIADVLNLLGIKELKVFQMQAIDVLTKQNQSLLLANKCGSGKSLCYVVPAIYFHKNLGKFTLVVEPSVVLIQEQVKVLQDQGISAIALGSPAGSAERSSNYRLLLEGKELPALVYCTPEYLFDKNGTLEQLQPLFRESLALLVLDEVHKVVDRQGRFRMSYDGFIGFAESLAIPVLGCSATISTKWKNILMEKYMPSSTQIITNSVILENVKIEFQKYERSKAKADHGCSSGDVDESGSLEKQPFSTSNHWTWEKVIGELKSVLEGQVAVCFVDFQQDAENIAMSLCEAGHSARFIVGGRMMAKEKQIASTSFKEGKEKTLIATETYECGMHNKNCTMSVRIGCARNTGVFIQEMGRTGREGKEGKFLCMWNEFHDDQRLGNWVKHFRDQRGIVNKENDEVQGLIKDFVASWKFIYSQYLGMCAKNALATFFESPGDQLHPAEFGKREGCNCQVCLQDSPATDIQKYFILLLKSINDMLSVTDTVTMAQLAGYMLQSNKKWYRDRPQLIQLGSYGCFTTTKGVSVEVASKLIRIGICNGFITLDYDFLTLGSGTLRCFRRISVSEIGNEFLLAPRPVYAPDPFSVTKETEANKKEGKLKGTKRSQSQIFLPTVKDMLQKPNEWKKIISEKDYRLLGYNISYKMPYIYFASNWREVKSAAGRQFMRNDLQLTKGQGQSLKQSVHDVTMEGRNERLIIQINKCKGCKKCPSNECNRGFSNYSRSNACPEHAKDFPNLVVCGEDCPVHFVYVYPLDEKDNRQWLGCISRVRSDPNGHNHPFPADWKLKSKTKTDLREVLTANPGIKPKELQKGKGLKYEPMLCDPAASHSGRIRRELSKAGFQTQETDKFRALKVMEAFPKIREEVEKRTDPNLIDKDIERELTEMMGNYCTTDHTCMIGERIFGFFVANWQLMMFKDITHLYMDITYVKNSDFPGLLNLVSPCDALKCYVPVARVFLNKQDTLSMAFALKKLFTYITEHCRNFAMGRNLQQLMVDFSDAEDRAVREVLPENLVEKIFRGCKFHFMKSVEKVATLVTETENQKALFVHLASKIPNCKDKETVKLIFNVLCGEAETKEVCHLVTDSNLREAAKIIENSGWRGTSFWAQWWQRKEHLAKLSLAFSQMSADAWESSQATNNPVESINRVSKTNTLCSIKEAIEHVYYEDRRYAFMLIAARHGRSITYT